MTTEEVGNVAAFLLSDLASGVMAEITYVDGGFSQAVAALRSLRRHPDVLIRAGSSL